MGRRIQRQRKEDRIKHPDSKLEHKSNIVVGQFDKTKIIEPSGPQKAKSTAKKPDYMDYRTPRKFDHRVIIEPRARTSQMRYFRKNTRWPRTRKQLNVGIALANIILLVMLAMVGIGTYRVTSAWFAGEPITLGTMMGESTSANPSKLELPEAFTGVKLTHPSNRKTL